MRLWRVSRYASIDGAGGLRVGGRWHSRGHPIVYACAHPAAALLEWLAHLELDASQVPATIPYVVLSVPSDIHSERVDALPDHWELRPAAARRLGDAWLAAARSALLYVPSAILPETDNVAINPSHGDAARITVERSFEHPFDVRLARR